MTDARVVSTTVEALYVGVPKRRAHAAHAEVLMTSGLAAPRKIESVVVEVLVKGIPFLTSTVYDSTNAMRQVWRWDGVNLVPVRLNSFGPLPA